MSKASRDKGKRGERMTATELRKMFPEYAREIRRGWQSRFGSDEADILGIPGFHLENKHGAKPNVRAALQQAIGDSSGRGLVPVAVIRDDRCEPFVVLRADDFWRLLRKAQGLGELVIEVAEQPPRPRGRRVVRRRETA